MAAGHVVDTGQARVHAAGAPVTTLTVAGRMVGEEFVRAMVAFLTNDSPDRARGRLVITEAPVQYMSRSVPVGGHQTLRTGANWLPEAVIAQSDRRRRPRAGVGGRSRGGNRLRVVGQATRPAVRQPTPLWVRPTSTSGALAFANTVGRNADSGRDSPGDPGREGLRFLA